MCFPECISCTIVDRAPSPDARGGTFQAILSPTFL